MITITMSRAGEPASNHRFEGDRIRIGREHDNDLVVPSASCSRHHAEIVVEAGLAKIIDLGSTNGIVIAGKRVDEYLLSDGQKFTIGDHDFEVGMPVAPSAKTVAIPIASAAPAPAPSKVLYLHIHERGSLRGIKVVAGADYVLGRSPGCDVVLEDSSCSGRHAVILWSDGRTLIRDLDSANGTRLNGEPIREAEVRVGDTVTVGRTEIDVNDRPVDTVDEDLLLKRTRLGMPVPARPDEVSGGPDRGSAADAPPIPRWAVIVACVAVLAIAAAVVGWRMIDRPASAPRTADAGPPSAELAVQVEPVLRKELSFVVSATGTVKPQRQVTVSAEVPGRVTAAPASEGSAVGPGDELVRLDDREIRLQISEASSSITAEQVELAREDYERKQRLFADGAATRSMLDQSKNHYLGLDSAYRSAQARIAQLQQRAAKTRITSPLAGVVARLAVSVGEFVSPGMPVAVIEDMEEVLVVVEVADRDVVRLRPLQVVEAISDAFPGKIFSGVLEKVGSAANPVTRSFEVEARIANPDGELRNGMIVALRVLLDKRSALVVPAEALIDETGDTARVVTVTGGVARSVEVAVGRRSDRDVEVLSGLAEGDQVVVVGHDRLRDGQPVKPYRAD